ncbi:hypothetical protein DPMN_074565 [Dreissena polymorpha]|uniref:Uncharacterized protein n=1 Tax=Dreissena polymorpha TaxID=45954 RepID=A0A9D3YF98_DREPO|nr:hypothetical protein DPMN_074565 [Dreissena polymorpha]
MHISEFIACVCSDSDENDEPEATRESVNLDDTDGRKGSGDGSAGAYASDEQDDSDDLECW